MDPPTIEKAHGRPTHSTENLEKKFSKKKNGHLWMISATSEFVKILFPPAEKRFAWIRKLTKRTGKASEARGTQRFLAPTFFTFSLSFLKSNFYLFASQALKLQKWWRKLSIMTFLELVPLLLSRKFERLITSRFRSYRSINCCFVLISFPFFCFSSSELMYNLAIFCAYKLQAEEISYWIKTYACCYCCRQC